MIRNRPFILSSHLQQGPRPTRLARWLLSSFLGGALIIGCLWMAHCSGGCITAADCNGLLCGPGRVCVVSCFAGETNGCPNGTVCNAKGDGCSPVTTAQDAGVSE